MHFSLYVCLGIISRIVSEIWATLRLLNAPVCKAIDLYLSCKVQRNSTEVRRYLRIWRRTRSEVINAVLVIVKEQKDRYVQIGFIRRSRRLITGDKCHRVRR